MKLCRYGKNGYEKPGMIDADGRLRDLSKVVDSIGPNELSPRGLKMLTKVKSESLPLVANHPRMGVPYIGIGKFIAIGLNYSDHAKEAGLPIPSEPVVFMKATTCINGPNDDISPAAQLDQARLGSRARAWYRHQGAVRVRRQGARACRGVLRDQRRVRASFQQATSQWDKGKGFDTAGPIGPWLVTTDEITDPQTLELWLDVNGKRMQSGNTRTMIFSVGEDHRARQRLHDAHAGGCDHHGHAARRRPGHEAEPGVPQAGRRDDARDPRPGRAAAEGGRPSRLTRNRCYRCGRTRFSSACRRARK
jgi:hypothetical protein